QGFARAHLGNALRVIGDLPAADHAFAVAQQLWKAGAAAPALLDPTRILDLEASLRRAQRRFADSLALLNEALTQAAAGEPTARLLIKKAFTQEQQGDYPGAISSLLAAAPLLTPDCNPRLRFAQRFNLAVALVHDGRAPEADALLPEVRAIAQELANDLDRVRVLWLESRVAAGLGARAEAVAKLEEVHRAFVERGLAYDTALAGLELAALYLEEGRHAEVRPLAAATETVLRAQRVQREALAAAWLFCEAAARDTVTLQLVRRWKGQLAG
ncbi:MAG TPA: hypothetical protein VEG34_15180, partial [Thermoanaerobaculia bacterium]|nr:hypothetical protein [Thermoanaerobaculia bacterium]